VVRRVVVAALLATVLAGCGDPVFVPEAGPNAPGYRTVSAPDPAEVELVRSVGRRELPVGGVVDTVVREDGVLRIDGWARLNPREPLGTLEVVLPPGSADDARVDDVTVSQRPDVVNATSDNTLVWSGFSISISGTDGTSTAVCVVSRSRAGAYRLDGSDGTLCAQT
jgi:hypothetical protein